MASNGAAQAPLIPMLPPSFVTILFEGLCKDYRPLKTEVGALLDSNAPPAAE